MSHGAGPTFDPIASRAESYHGAYGRLCPDLPGWSPEGVPEERLDAHFLEFANQKMVEVPGAVPEALALAPEAARRDEYDSDIPAGYTYLGQFIDHDITYNPASELMRTDPGTSRNFRTPRLDLDSVYGRGPDDQPYLYDQRSEHKGKMLIGEIPGSKLRDLPRNAQGRALIGDMRNDENAMVSQLHLAFLLAHNTLVERAKRSNGIADPFKAASKTLRWLYQHIAWNDFLARVTRQQVHRRALQGTAPGDGPKKWTLGLSHVYDWERQPFMPVEFSAAAYRFGHSMVRSQYQTNELRRRNDVPAPAPLFDSSAAADRDDLRGLRPMATANVIQWSWFLNMTSSPDGFPQMARRIDTKLANSLAHLHGQRSPMNVLAFRNLKRGWAFGLPAGTAIARKYDIEPVRLAPGEPDALWFYLLREAESQPGGDGGNRLGPLGSTIVCATIASLLRSDPNSYFRSEPAWEPSDDPLLLAGEDNIDGERAPGQSPRDCRWTLASIIRIAGLPIRPGDMERQALGDFPEPWPHP
jgi:hypothetical protein